MSPFRLAHFSPGRLLLISIAALIALGTGLLALPMARTTSISLIDLIFTATSATCVTGLFTIPLSHFTFFGQCVLLALIQIGGLGIVTITLFFMSVFLRVGLGIQVAAGELLELHSWKDIKRFLIFIVSTSIVLEFLGSCILFWRFGHYYTHKDALFYGIFHAISSFCNAGITLFPTNFQNFTHDYLLLGTCMILMLLGGLGFITLYELIIHFKERIQDKRHMFSLHTKIILWGTSISIAVTTILIWLCERQHSFASSSYISSIFYALFEAISFRSTGVSIFPISALTLATIMIMMIVSFIGSSPGSTGSGVKISTFIVYLGLLRSAITDQSEVNIRSRKIPQDQLNKAIAIISLSGTWIVVSTFVLVLLEPNLTFISLLVESVSAFSNLGITYDLTNQLSSWSKGIILISIIIGRIGSLTLILALRKIGLRKKTSSSEFSYPEERIMLS